MKQDKGLIAQAAAWKAVFALAFGVAGLITSEFLPISVLSPMARDLQITQGIAGQAISITAIVAMLASILTPLVTRGIDRKWVLLTFCVLQFLSNMLVALATNFMVLTIGRLLLGAAIGGFWTMSAAIAMRLVPEKDVPKALSVIFGAVSVATVVAAPMGSYLGAMFGWRIVFGIAGGLGILAFVSQAVTLPSLPAEKPAALGKVVGILKRPGVKMGFVATLWVFAGYSTFFTYLRPFLEKISGIDVNILSLILLVFGVANLIGTTLARHLLERNLSRSLSGFPIIMGLMVAGLLTVPGSPLLAAGLIGMWGLAFGVIQVGWPTWLTRTIADEAEIAGGIQVAVIQLAITTGAGIGGWVVDRTGVSGVYSLSSVITVIAGFITIMAFRKRPRLSKVKSWTNR